MSFPQKVWSAILYGYFGNALVSLSLFFGNVMLDDFAIGFFFLAIGPAFGAYLTQLLWQNSSADFSKLAHLLTQCVLFVLVVHVQFLMFKTYGFETYSRHMAFLSASLFFPWLVYAGILNSILVLIYFFTRFFVKSRK